MEVEECEADASVAVAQDDSATQVLPRLSSGAWHSSHPCSGRGKEDPDK